MSVEGTGTWHPSSEPVNDSPATGRPKKVTEENEGEAGENVVTFARDPRAGAAQAETEEAGRSERETHHKRHTVTVLFPPR